MVHDNRHEDKYDVGGQKSDSSTCSIIKVAIFKSNNGFRVLNEVVGVGIVLV